MKKASITFTDYGDGRCVVEVDPPYILERDIDKLNEIELAALKGLLTIRESDIFDHRLIAKGKT